MSFGFRAMILTRHAGQAFSLTVIANIYFGGLPLSGTLGSKPALLFALKQLDFALVFLCLFTCIKCAQVLALPRFGVFLFRVQAILAGFQFSNHRNAPEHGVSKLVPYPC